jgi:hypothetical protein
MPLPLALKKVECRDFLVRKANRGHEASGVPSGPVIWSEARCRTRAIDQDGDTPHSPAGKDVLDRIAAPCPVGEVHGA